MGTALALQTSLGFAISTVSIELATRTADRFGSWGPGMAILSVGPVVGIAAMVALRRHPESRKLAGGRR